MNDEIRTGSILSQRAATVYSLGEIATFKSGGTPSKSDTEYWNGDYPWVTAKDLKSITVSHSVDRLSESGYRAANIAPKGSLLVLVRGMTLHKDVPVCLAGRDVAFNQDIKALIPASSINAKYLVYYLQSQKNRLLRLVDSAGHGTGRINTDLLKAFSVAVPTLAVQASIVDLLSICDEAIEKAERLITAKEREFKWLLKKLIGEQWNNPARRKIKLEEAFGNELIIEKGTPLKKTEMRKGDFPVIAGGQNYAFFHDKFTHNVETITISSSGAYAGFVWFHGYPIFATDCNVIRARRGHVKYFYYAIKMQQNRIYALQSGGAQPHIYAKDIATLYVPVPPVIQQEKIANVLDLAQKKIELLRQLTEKYREQKKGLMQKLLTGQWLIRTGMEAV